MDFERNLGPCCSLLKAHFTTSSYNVRGLDLGHQKHYRPSCISYERNRLLSLRHWSKHYCSPEFLGKLKSLDLLRYRRKRAGRLNKQKSTGNGLRIPVICSGRRHYSVSLNIQNATSRLQICESRPLGVNVNNLICIRPDPLRFKLSTVVPLDFFLFTISTSLPCQRRSFVVTTRIYIISVTFVQMDMFSTMSFDYILLVAGLALFSRIISRPKFKHMNPIALSNILSWNSGLRTILSV